LITRLRANAAPRDLVLVGRTDAARRRPNSTLAAPRFRKDVQLAVIREDEVRPIADEQPALHVDVQVRQVVYFGK
jgi:hypothetical protein